MSSTRRGLKAADALALGGLVAAGTALALPWRLPPLCPMRLLLRVPCPSCGMTRAVAMAARGQLAAATALHPLWPVVAAAALLVAAAAAVARVRTGRYGGPWVRRVVAWGGPLLLALFLVVWVARFFGAFGGPAPIE